MGVVDSEIKSRNMIVDAATKIEQDTGSNPVRSTQVKPAGNSGLFSCANFVSQPKVITVELIEGREVQIIKEPILQHTSGVR